MTLTLLLAFAGTAILVLTPLCLPPAVPDRTGDDA